MNAINCPPQVRSSQVCPPQVLIPRTPIAIRPATLADLPFIDALQKKQSKQLGFLRASALEQKVRAEHVLIAEEPSPQPVLPAISAAAGVPGEGVGVGYCIGTDRYLKHEDIGIIYQLNVAASHRRSLVGAMLVKAMFDRAAYGCKLFCCWCAQDIEANHFWESIGFLPIAFRAGSEKRSRVHIFWQRRIREGDTTTPYWFPSQTSGGAISEARLVLPIPPGTHWSDVMPMVLPKEELPVVSGQLPVKRDRSGGTPKPRKKEIAKPALGAPLWFGPPVPAKAVVEKVKPQRKPKRKNDPKLVAAARELRDRYLEQFNSGRILPGGKYDVSRLIEATPAPPAPPAPVKQLAA